MKTKSCDLDACASAPRCPNPAPVVERPAWRIIAPVDRPARPDWTTILIALALGAVSGGFSIYGMTAIFSGAFWPVIAMGAALELGKMRAIVLVGTGRGSRRLRAALVVMVGILMGLNAIGCYGFLAKAHIGHQVEGDVQVAGRLADVDGRIAVQSATLADIDRRLGQIDGAIEKAMAQGKVNGAMALANDQRSARTVLQVDRMAAGKVLAELKVERARIDGERRTVEADLGPVRYLATLLGVDAESALRVFILVVSMLLDPFAVLLLLAATRKAQP
jgi:hypothetical protein